MNATDEQIRAGAAVYTLRNLATYDFVVLGLSNRWVWKCPTAVLLKHYNHHVSGNHLDVGVGSGYYPDRCAFPVAEPRLGLLDLNQDALDYASTRVARYRPEIYCGNVLQPLTLDCRRFDSVALHYVLHCLPGTIRSKAVALDHLAEMLSPRGTLFGSTLLSIGVRRNRAARGLMRMYNAKGIFSNRNDSLDELNEVLAERFASYEINVIGSVALFHAHGPHSPRTSPPQGHGT